MLEEKLRALENQYAELEARLAAPETYADPARVAQLNREQRELEPVVTAYRAYERAQAGPCRRGSPPLRSGYEGAGPGGVHRGQG